MSSRFILITACYQLLLLLLSCLWPHGLQHIRLSCPSPSLWTCSNSCSLSLWCHPTISSSVIPFTTCPQSFPASGTFLMNRLCIRWPKYWSFNFSISPSNEYSGLVSFRIDWFHLLAVEGTLKSSPTPQFKSVSNSSAVSLLYGPPLISVHDYWKDHSFDLMDLCW